jgi:mannose-6-phosphate isomerase-like protein (cupin superfamily)
MSGSGHEVGPTGEDVAMQFFEAADYTADRPWGALPIADIDGATVRLHWTDQPYVWHVNDGTEVFVVLDGSVDMRYRRDGEERVEHLTPGRICLAEVGDEHVAHPTPEARILVVERAGSI